MNRQPGSLFLLARTALGPSMKAGVLAKPRANGSARRARTESALRREPIAAGLARTEVGPLIALALACVACGSTPGAAIVEHPRSQAIVAVAPESDALAGAVTFRPGASAPTRAAARPSLPERRLVLPVDVAPAAITTGRDVIYVGAWNLALGDDETSIALEPAVALATALSLSTGPAPRLGDAPRSLVILQVSEEALEEGAWQASRR